MAYTIIIVIHNTQRAHRTSDQSGFGDTEKIFSHPLGKSAEAYIPGRLR